MAKFSAEQLDIFFALVLFLVGLGYSVSGLSSSIIVACWIWVAAWCFISHLYFVHDLTASCPGDVRVILWGGLTFMVVLILWNPVRLQYLKEHTTVVQVLPQNIIVSPPQPTPLPAKKVSFRVTGVQVIPPKPNEILNLKVSAQNMGEVDIKGPTYSFATTPSPWILSDVGERHLFELVASRSGSKLINPGLEVYPGQEIGFETKNMSGWQTDDDFMKKVNEGRMYILILLQYGNPRERAFDDGLKRPHSVFCGYFEKISDSNIRLCRGFNYVRPEE